VTYYTITNATTTPAVVSDPKTGAIYTHCIFFRSENGWDEPLPAALRRRRRQDVFSDPVRVNDKEGEAGNSGGLRKETAKSTHTLWCLIGCNNIREGIGGAAIEDFYLAGT